MWTNQRSVFKSWLITGQYSDVDQSQASIVVSVLPVKVYRLHNLCVDEGEEPAAVVQLLLHPGAASGGHVVFVPVVIPAGVHVQLPAPITGQCGVLTNKRSVFLIITAFIMNVNFNFKTVI